MNDPINVLANRKLAAHNVTKIKGARIRSGIQPLQSVKTLEAKPA